MSTMRTYYSPAVERAESAGTEWRQRSACKDMPKGMFYSEFRHEQEEAKRVCFEECLVRLACLNYAITAGEVEFGIFGGKTPAERNRLRKARGRAS